MSQDVLARSVRDPDSLAIGDPVEINGKQGFSRWSEPGVLVSISTTRAGRTLRYKYRIVKVVEDHEEGYDPA